MFLGIKMFYKSGYEWYMNKPLCKTLLKILVYVSATGVEISGLEKKNDFEKTAFKDMDCKIPYIFSLQVNRVKKMN